MVEVADRAAEAAWKIRNLDDYEERFERAVRSAGEIAEPREAALVVYEAALMKSGRPREEVLEMVRAFRETFEDEEEPLTIARTSGLMNVEGDEWFFGDENLRVLTGRLLGQFQHRVAQYNYIDENEVLRRWADGYDTRLFIRRRVHDTEPVVGVVGGFDLPLMQYLRVIACGDTLVPTENVARALAALGYEEGDDYTTLARAESLALHLELPAPVVGEMLAELGREGFTDYPEPPPVESAAEGGSVDAAQEAKPGPEQRAGRGAAREDPVKGEEPTRIQDPQAKDAPGVKQESGDRDEPAAPEAGRDGEPGASDREEGGGS
ncbi:MAG TPA: hypothetical protein VK869_13810 [Rubrobacteraceae bacterium]|nr:hypothetical protein [Rubrobacteraceae bacterium]